MGAIFDFLIYLFPQECQIQIGVEKLSNSTVKLEKGEVAILKPFLSLFSFLWPSSLIHGSLHSTAVRRHCTDWYEIWALTDHEIYYIKIELDLRKFSNGPFSETEKGFWVNPTPGGSQCTGLSPTHESDLAPLFHPLSALSLKETTLSGWKWCHKMSQNASNHAPWHEIQLGKSKFTFPAKEVTFPATFVNSFILLFHC